MTSPFFNGRKVIAADELTGPRVYSTDLLPSLYDLKKLDDGVAFAARALKIKIITKGLVTFNSVYLVSPLVVRLLDLHPDLLEGTAILPAFRTDKSDLSSLVASTEGHAAAGISEARLGAHIQQLEPQLRQVMPWELADVSDQFGSAVVGGLRKPDSTIAQELAVTNSVPLDRLERIARDIESIDLRESVNLRNYISTLSPNIGGPLLRFASACYHRVGTAVVRCETGMDLGTLSEFKAADLVLAGRVQGTLSDEAVFLELFLGLALDTIQAAALPSQIIDAMRFETAHQLGNALREQGFQERYDEITRQYAAAKSSDNSLETLERIDAERIAGIAGELAAEFKKAVLNELPDYETKIRDDAKDDLYCTTADLFKEGLGATPVVGNLVSIATAAGLVADAARGAKTLITTRDQNAAFSAARKKRIEDIRDAIDGLKASGSKKAKLLHAVALMSDVHGISLRRA